MPLAGIDHPGAPSWRWPFTRYDGRIEDPQVAVARGLIDNAKAAKANILGLALCLGPNADRRRYGPASADSANV